MAATVKASAFTGVNTPPPTRTSIDSTDTLSQRFGRSDVAISTTTIPIPVGAPSGTGTVFSYKKWTGLYVTAGGGSTSLSNLKVNAASAYATGITVWFGGTATYTQETGVQGTAAGQYPPDEVTNGHAPQNQTNITWTQMTTSAQVYDATGGAATNSALCGKYCALCMGVDGTYAGGGNANTAMPNTVYTYDEAAEREIMTRSEARAARSGLRRGLYFRHAADVIDDLI